MNYFLIYLIFVRLDDIIKILIKLLNRWCIIDTCYFILYSISPGTLCLNFGIGARIEYLLSFAL